MKKMIAAAAFCTALLIGSGSVLSAAAEGIPSAPGFICAADEADGETSSHWATSYDIDGNEIYVDWALESDGTLRISGTGSMPYISDYDPAPWADSKDKIKKVVVEDGIKNVSNMAFMDCTNLTEAELGKDVTSLGEKAFAGCTSLKVLIYGDQLNSFYRDVFKDSAWLADRIEETPLVIINSVLLEAHTATGDVVIPDTVKHLMANAFEDAEDMTSVVIPDGVEELPSRVFAGCTGLKSVTFPGGLYTIDSEAFAGCTSLTKVELPSAAARYNTRSIRTAAFSGCTSLADVTIPESWKAIECTAFSGTPWFESLQKENPLVVINNNIIDGSTCKGEVVIPEGVESIPSTAFAGNTEITSIVLPASLTDARTPNIFNGCTGLTKITIRNPLYDPTAMLTNFGGPSFSGTIAGYDSSSAESYAAAKELTFESIGSFVGKYSALYLKRMTPTTSHRPGETATVTSEIDLFTLGNSIGEAEFELVNADDLPFSVTFAPVIQNGLTINSNADHYSKVNLSITYSLPTDMETGTYTMEFRATKLTDLEGNDLLALAAEGDTQFGEYVFASGDPVYPTGLLAPVEYDGAYRPVLDQFKQWIADGWDKYAGKTASGVVNSEDLTSISPLWLDGEAASLSDAWYFIDGDGLLFVGAGDGGFYDAYSCVDGKLLHVCSADENTTYQRYSGAMFELKSEADPKVYPYTDLFFKSSQLPAYTATFYKLTDGALVPDISVKHLDVQDPDKAYQMAETPAAGEDFDYQAKTFSELQSSGITYRYPVVSDGVRTYLSQLTDGSEQPEFDPTAVEGLGDINDDNAVNATDAAKMLIEAAVVGAGKASTLSAEAAVRADVNGDKVVNASDAAVTLQYAAFVGAGGAGTFGEYVKDHMEKHA